MEESNQQQLNLRNESNQFKCNYCTRVFTTFLSLSSHRKRVHRSGKKRVHRQIQCPICKKSFLATNILQHTKNNHKTTLKSAKKKKIAKQPTSTPPTPIIPTSSKKKKKGKKLTLQEIKALLCEKTDKKQVNQSIFVSCLQQLDIIFRQRFQELQKMPNFSEHFEYNSDKQVLKAFVKEFMKTRNDEKCRKAIQLALKAQKYHSDRYSKQMSVYQWELMSKLGSYKGYHLMGYTNRIKSQYISRVLYFLL